MSKYTNKGRTNIFIVIRISCFYLKRRERSVNSSLFDTHRHYLSVCKTLNSSVATTGRLISLACNLSPWLFAVCLQLTCQSEGLVTSLAHSLVPNFTSNQVSRIFLSASSRRCFLPMVTWSSCTIVMPTTQPLYFRRFATLYIELFNSK